MLSHVYWKNFAKPFMRRGKALGSFLSPPQCGLFYARF